MMHTHEFDRASLASGIVLAAITALLALAVFGDVDVTLGVVVPTVLITIGLLGLVAAFVRRPSAPEPSTSDEPPLEHAWGAEGGSPADAWATEASVAGAPAADVAAPSLRDTDPVPAELPDE